MGKINNNEIITIRYAKHSIISFNYFQRKIDEIQFKTHYLSYIPNVCYLQQFSMQEL